MIDILFATVVGIAVGTVSGITPGIHVNTAILLFLSIITGMSLSPAFIASAILAAAITHSVLDFIPTIFLGAPSSDTVISLLPGHRLLLQGRGIQAIKFTIIGAVLSTIFIWPLLIYINQIIEIMPHFYEGVKLTLFAIMAWCIIEERKMKKIIVASCISLFAGVLGIISFNKLPHVLFPILTGLFAIPTLLESVKRKTDIPLQKEAPLHIKNSKGIISGIKGAISGSLVGILPGIGPAQAALISNIGSPPEEYLLTVGGINTASAIAGILILNRLNLARSGALMAIQSITSNIFNLNILYGVALLSVGMSAMVGLIIIKQIYKVLRRFKYRDISKMLIISLIGISYIYTGILGLILLVTSSCIGILPLKTKTRRVHLMNVLVLPLLLQ